MIQNAVFVLGAGASYPYGFPSGKELRKQICLNHVSDCDSYLKTKEGVDEDTINQQHKTAQRFVDKFRRSSTKSIDLFLARNPEFSQQGKRAIILRIIHAEHKSRFREDIKDGNKDWYFWLFDQMTNKLVRKPDFAQFADNGVSFITFNYDRSLEYFLYDSLINSFNGIPEGKIIEQLNSIEICHVFGQIGPLQWQHHNDPLHYADVLKNVNVDSLCENIRIVHDQDDGENPNLDKARVILNKANRIFFLGFGYAQENLNALSIPKILGETQIFGTALGLTKREIQTINSLLISKRPNRSVFIEDLDCLALLRKYL